MRRLLPIALAAWLLLLTAAVAIVADRQKTVDAKAARTDNQAIETAVTLEQVKAFLREQSLTVEPERAPLRAPLRP